MEGKTNNKVELMKMIICLDGLRLICLIDCIGKDNLLALDQGLDDMRVTWGKKTKTFWA